MSELVSKMLVEESGEEIGKITDVIANPFDLEPEWIVVKMGRFGGEHLVPLGAVERRDSDVGTRFSKQHVKDAPKVRQHTAPTSDERAATYEHYGLPVPDHEGVVHHTRS